MLSAELANRAGFDLAGHELRTLTMRGRVAPLDAWIIADAEEIQGLTRPSTVA